jgi:hypothetical protein
MDAIVANACADGAVYERAGFDAVLVENFGDAPFYPGRVPPETVAALAVAAGAVRRIINIPCGVNCLRNDGLAAVGIAAAAGLDFVRVNVLAGAVVADQGIVVSGAHEVLRARARLAPQCRILADVHVKHAAPIADRPVEEEARDLVERALADAVVVSGARTGSPPDVERLRSVAQSIAGTPVFAGSGLTLDNARELLQIASGAVVGTSVKRDGRTEAPVDPARAAALVAAAHSTLQ